MWIVFGENDTAEEKKDEITDSGTLAKMIVPLRTAG